MTFGKIAAARYGKKDFGLMQKSMQYKYFQAIAKVIVETSSDTLKRCAPAI